MSDIERYRMAKIIDDISKIVLNYLKDWHGIYWHCKPEELNKMLNDIEHRLKEQQDLKSD